MKFRPLHDRVLVEREESDEKSAGGIIIPDTAKEKPMQGKIIAVGSGSKDEQGKVTPLDVKAGDTILIPDGDFHQVHNTGFYAEDDLEFICVFDGGRNH